MQNALLESFMSLVKIIKGFIGCEVQCGNFLIILPRGSVKTNSCFLFNYLNLFLKKWDGAYVYLSEVACRGQKRA